jgi:hypothetical protein
MKTEYVVLIAIAILAIILYVRHRKAVILAAKPKQGSGLPILDSILKPNQGVAARKAAENIPVYGSVVKVAGVVGRPLNKALDTVNNNVVAGLNHIPIAGKYLAMPNKYAGAAVKSINNWIGL